MRRIVMAVVSLLLLAGCAGTERDASADPTLPSSTASTPTTTTAAPETSSRGNRVKKLGENAFFCSDNSCSGPMAVTFTVDSITPDIQCTSGFANAPDHGHFIGIALRVSTSSSYPSDMYTTFTAAEFAVIGADGLTVSDVQGQAATCLGPNGFTFDPLGPGQQYAGTVVIDSPVTSGILMYLPSGVTNGGWEWQF